MADAIYARDPYGTQVHARAVAELAAATSTPAMQLVASQEYRQGHAWQAFTIKVPVLSDALP